MGPTCLERPTQPRYHDYPGGLGREESFSRRQDLGLLVRGILVLNAVDVPVDLCTLYAALDVIRTCAR